MFGFAKKFPVFLQFDSNDCGPACLKSIFEYYRVPVSFNKIRKKCRLSFQGTTLNTLKEVSEIYNFDGIIISCSFSEIVNNPILPGVFIINGHFVVVYKIDESFVYVSDPAIGRIKYGIQQFIRIWEDIDGNGLALLIRPNHKGELNTDVDEREENNDNLLQSIKKYLGHEYSSFILIFICLIIGSGIQFLLPFFMQLIIDNGVKFDNYNLIYLLCFGQFALILSKLTIDLVRKWVLIHITTIFNVSLIYRFLLKIVKIPLSYFEFRSYGDLLQRIEDHKRIDRLINYSTINTFFSFFTLIIYSILLFHYNLKIFAVIVVFIVVYVFYNLIFTKQRKILDYKNFQESSSNRDSIFQLIFGIKEIKLFQAEDFMISKWESVQKKIFEINIKSSTISNYQSIGASFINETKNLFVLVLCCFSVMNGDMTLGMMFTIQFIIGTLNTPINDFIAFVNEYIEADMASKRIDDLYGIPDEDKQDSVNDNIHKRIKNVINGSVSNTTSRNELLRPSLADVKKVFVKNLYFSYEKSLTGEQLPPVINGVDFQIERGKMTAIVGSSGSGKTTILKLLLGFYDYDKGDILLDNQSIKGTSINSWRSMCSTVLQDGYIFSDTLANNIAMGDNNISQRKVWEAVKLSELSELVDSFPLKTETVIGSNGHGLSQGQKQRILIARAIYKDSPFFFFDEATSSLDSLNESKIMDNIYKNLKKKGILVIAHRLSTIVNADEILVLDKGKIVERGRHDDLLGDKGFYYQLVKAQVEI